MLKSDLLLSKLLMHPEKLELDLAASKCQRGFCVAFFHRCLLALEVVAENSELFSGGVQTCVGDCAVCQLTHSGIKFFWGWFFFIRFF